MKLRVNALAKVTVALLLCLVLWVPGSLAQAFDNPELLPDFQTPVLDLTKALTKTQAAQLEDTINTFERETGWKLRVLTQRDETPGRAVKDYWQLDEKSVLLVADARGGNILNFSVGEEVYQLLPRTFWVELQTRFGNQYFVRDEGEDQSILQALGAVQGCLAKGGCNVVPGLPQEQWIFTLITSLAGGIICGFAGRPRKPDQVFAWQWALIFSPLWGMLFISFGIGPVVTRTSDWVPLVRNIGGFLLGFLGAYMTQWLGPEPASDALD
ncbi:TPM domain-containing protein [Lyngbya confervoides]|uniref:TPM domain-containing protein n=1 Tax=Lyngbya confervoides BDU141951 TaxID=1574623 RepID=A0ABD4SZQ9_9CYAN|nr:TPM domain-containing protein [Lyngbya confervoides]MCM1981799.1 TPM domain-containing protein [Lyngbya confervoides BDU141951]